MKTSKKTRLTPKERVELFWSLFPRGHVIYDLFPQGINSKIIKLPLSLPKSNLPKIKWKKLKKEFSDE